MELFNRFQPKFAIKEKPEIFRRFARISVDEADLILKSINKAIQDE